MRFSPAGTSWRIGARRRVERGRTWASRCASKSALRIFNLPPLEFHSMLDNIRIVLVEPAGSANIGAVCRAMANMGLRELVLVAPQCDVNTADSRAYAMHGQWILHAARIVPDVPAALAECVLTIATTAKLGLYRRQAAAPPDETARIALAAAQSGPVAFAFGREASGLTTAELLHFDRIVTIPANPEYPVLNLAAATLIVCYELWQAAQAAAGEPPLPAAIPPEPANDERKRMMFTLLFEALDQIDYFRGQSPDHLKYAIRQALGRAQLSIIECDVLIGVARQIQYYVRNYGVDLRAARAQNAAETE